VSKIKIINTGGTFNKVYDELKGYLVVPRSNAVIEEIIEKYIRSNQELNLKGMIFKDSLEITNNDRQELCIEIRNNKKVLIIHGTDTMNETAEFIANKYKDEKCIVLTGAMQPYSIDKTEATANFTQALTFLNQTDKKGVYISMHGLNEKHNEICKNRELGKFECQ
jgi:L-asparaginase